MIARAAVATALALLGALGCGGKRKAPAVAPPPADAIVTPIDAAPIADAASVAPPPSIGALPPWSGEIPPCVTAASIGAGYGAAMTSGRAAAKAHRWVDAVAAFQRAQHDRPDDPTSANELAWALVMVGDGDAAYQAVKPALGAADPKVAAAAQYNAGRAAEAAGMLDLAADHYAQSVALRPSDTVDERRAALDAGPRAVPTRPLLAGCTDLPTADAACACVSADLSRLPGGAGAGTCTWATPTRGGEVAHARIAAITSADEADGVAAGVWLVLMVERGDRWSALTVVGASADVDLGATPNAASTVTLAAIVATDELLVVESASTDTDQGAGVRTVDAERHLTICRVPPAASASVACTAELPLARWEYQGEDDACSRATGQAFRIQLIEGGGLSQRLIAGTDDRGVTGRYQLLP